MRRTSLALAAVALLAACDTRGAGDGLDTGGFGNATMLNHQVMVDRSSAVQSLAKRFAAEVDSTVTFDFDSARLTHETRDTLRRQAHWIRQFPEARFRVYGHTDLVGSPSYNHRLGMQRARAVVDALVAHGVARSRLEAVVSYGERQPLVVTEGRERRNRRTVTEVSGFVDGSTVLDGRYAEVIYRGYVESAAAPTGLSAGSGGLAGAGGAAGGE